MLKIIYIYFIPFEMIGTKYDGRVEAMIKTRQAIIVIR
jgi:hypothetical protein